MSIKSIIKLFIPPILFQIKSKLLLHKKRIKNSYISTIDKIEKNSNTLIVIGNGSSLQETFEKNKEKIKSCDSIVVNHFCETKYYKELQPKYYLLADPAFFGNIDSYAEWLQEKIRKFIVSIVNNTTWNLNLIVPSSAFGSDFVEKCKENKYIQLYYYNSFDTCNYDDTKKFCLWDKNLLSVPAQTCLNTSLWLGIFLRYKEIYLIGADTTWIELLHVDQVTNEVYTIDSHFYGQKKRNLYKDIEAKIPVKLHEELDSISNALKNYWELKDYAEYAAVKVYNASEYSLIDAFERKKLSDRKDI